MGVIKKVKVVDGVENDWGRAYHFGEVVSYTLSEEVMRRCHVKFWGESILSRSNRKCQGF